MQRSSLVSTPWAAFVLVCLAAPFLGGCDRQPPPPPAETPRQGASLVLISVDTLRADRLNSYGYTARHVSPHMDALARDGILFENHMTSSPWTTPAHLTLLTSLSPSAHGVTRPFDEIQVRLSRHQEVESLPDHRTTLAELLSAEGYRTAAFTGGSSLDPRLGFEQGFGLYDTSMFKLDRRNMERLFDWVRQNREHPFFLFWHTFEVHAPYLHADFVPEVLPEPRAAEVRRSTERIVQDMARGGTVAHQAVELGRIGALNREVCEALYVGGIRAMDERIGAFIGLLRELGLYDRTLIVLTSDHGEEFAERSPTDFFNKHGHTLYEEMVRVPLILKLPGSRYGNVRVGGVTRAIDVMPTVLAELGFRGGAEMEGSPLQPLFRSGGGGTAERVAFIEALSSRTTEAKAVRTDGHKYIVSMDAETLAAHGRGHVPETPAGQALYDLRSDPGEKRNLLAHPTSRHPLAAILDRRLREQANAAKGQPDRARLDPEAVERLRALGYVDN